MTVVRQKELLLVDILDDNGVVMVRWSLAYCAFFCFVYCVFCEFRPTLGRVAVEKQNMSDPYCRERLPAQESHTLYVKKGGVTVDVYRSSAAHTLSVEKAT